jgi:PIN domain nuclease of toxin-antitoxin system
LNRYLVDTSILIWLLKSQPMPAQVDALLSDRANIVYYSVISIVELSIKHAKGHLPLPRSMLNDPAAAISDTAADASLLLLPLAPEHAVKLMTLPRLHNDPFDRLLIAQAIVQGFTMVSEDGKFPLYTDLKLLPF